MEQQEGLQPDATNRDTQCSTAWTAVGKPTPEYAGTTTAIAWHYLESINQSINRFYQSRAVSG
jgi:hypothetical protein